MNIRNRLITYFTAIAGLLVISTFLIVYILIAQAREQSFNERLKERIDLSEKFLVEFNDLSKDIKTKIKKEFNQKLYDENEVAIPIFYSQNLTSLNIDNEALVAKIVSQDEFFFKLGGIQGVSKKYKVKNTDYIVIVTAFDKYGFSYLKQIRTILIIVCIISIFLMLIVSTALANRMLKPLSKKIEKAKVITANNLNERLIVYNKNDEIGRLALAFNNMLDRLEESFTLQKNFVRYASHEIKNPLTAILGEIEVSLSKERTVNEYIHSLQSIYIQTENLNVLVNKFLSLPNKDKLNNEEFRVDELLINEVIKIKQLNNQIEIVFDISEDIQDSQLNYKGDQKLLGIAINNLLENSVKYESDTVKISLKLVKEDLILMIEDDGIGIKPDDKTKIFEPLFRGTNTHEIGGTGMGLYLVNQILKLHEIDISVESKIDDGTSIKLTF